MLDLFMGEIRKVRSEFPTDPIFLMGDWNMPAVNGVSILRSETNEPQWYAVPLARSRQRGVQRCGDIDHIMVYGQSTSLMGRRLETWDISDHVPVELSIDLGDIIQSTGVTVSQHTGPARKRIEVRTIRNTIEEKTRAQGIATSNYWDVLQDSDTEDGAGPEANELDYGFDQDQADTAAEKWVSAAHNIAKENAMYTKPRVPHTLSNRVKRVIRKRRDIFLVYKRTRLDDPLFGATRQRYFEAQRHSRLVIRKDRRQKWRKAVFEATKDLKLEPRRFWQWASRTAGWRLRGGIAGIQPMQDAQGRLVTDLESVRQVWSDHFSELARDVTGHSRDPEYWRTGECGPQRRHLVELDRDLTENEIRTTLRGMKRNKAPGSDGIPLEFLLMSDENSPMLTKLTQLCNFVWKTGIIPKLWQESIVVPILKKGDPTDPGNYRGISLMSVTLKVITTLLSKRLNKTLESENLFSPGQAGFRTREECTTQFACVYEICQRRKIASKPTYLVFVDFKKAYDTVPHEGLMEKLRQIGIRGRTLRFIQGLYRHSTMRVRCGTGSEAVLSEGFDLDRGLRQGCAISPILFNIFINDVFDGAKRLGVSVPIGTVAEHDSLPERIPGTLFADDLLGLCPTMGKLKKMCAHISQWAERNEMQVGIAKCGIMTIGDSMERLRIHGRQFVIGGERVPVVDQYTYLGMVITPSLDRNELLTLRFEQARRTVHGIGAFLRCPVVPIYVRARVLKAVVLPRLLFGAEIYGCCRVLTDRMQIFMNQALRSLVGLSAKATVANVALWREFKIQPLCALAAARRVRAYQKCASLKTWVRELVNHPYRSRSWTWVTGTTRWMNRYYKRLHSTGARPTQSAWLELSPTAAKRRVTKMIGAREESLRMSKTGKRYIEAEFDSQRVISIKMACPTVYNEGLMYIAQCRMNGRWWGERMARHKLIHARYLEICPCCSEYKPETLEHAFLECPRWTEYRDGIQALITEASTAVVNSAGNRVDASSSVSCEVVNILLGGRVRDWKLERWLVPVTEGCEPLETESEAQADDPESDEEDLDATATAFEYTRECSGLRVATFLALVIRARAPIIRSLRRGPGGSQREGPASTSDQSPDG
jgi:hypothetical protein